MYNVIERRTKIQYLRMTIAKRKFFNQILNIDHFYFFFSEEKPYISAQVV